MSNDEPRSPSPKLGDCYGELTWTSIYFGAFAGSYFALWAMQWGVVPIVSIGQVGFVLLMSLFSALTYSQLRIGIGLLQDRSWAVKASFLTNCALLAVGLLATVIHARFVNRNVSPFLFVVAWSIWNLWRLSRSDWATEVANRPD